MASSQCLHSLCLISVGLGLFVPRLGVRSISIPYKRSPQPPVWKHVTHVQQNRRNPHNKPPSSYCAEYQTCVATFTIAATTVQRCNASSAYLRCLSDAKLKCDATRLPTRIDEIFMYLQSSCRKKCRGNEHKCVVTGVVELENSLDEKEKSKLIEKARKKTEEERIMNERRKEIEKIQRERERKEKELKEREVKEWREKMEKMQKEKARKERERKEWERIEKERKEKDMDRTVKEWREKMEIDKVQKEKARKQNERLEKERKEKERERRRENEKERREKTMVAIKEKHETIDMLKEKKSGNEQNKKKRKSEPLKGNHTSSESSDSEGYTEKITALTLQSSSTMSPVTSWMTRVTPTDKPETVLMTSTNHPNGAFTEEVGRPNKVLSGDITRSNDGGYKGEDHIGVSDVDVEDARVTEETMRGVNRWDVLGNNKGASLSSVSSTVCGAAAAAMFFYSVI